MPTRSKLNNWKADNQMGRMPPIMNMQPVLSSGIVGLNLSVNTGTYVYGTPDSISVQWNVNGVPASGKTGLVYGLLSVLDVGKVISATVTATNQNGSTVITTDGVSIL